MADTIQVENINHPGKVYRADAVKYAAMRAAFLEAMPKAEPGLTQAEMIAAVKPHLADDLFPDGKTAGWWATTVQLDLEAKGLLARKKAGATRWWLTGL